MWPTRRLLWLTLALGVTMRVAAVLFLWQRPDAVWIDTDAFYDRALRLGTGPDFVTALTVGHFTRAPLYPVFLRAGVLLGLGLLGLLIAQAILCGGATVWGVHWLTRAIADARAAASAALAIAVWPMAVGAAGSFWTEQLDTPLVVLALAATVRALQAPSGLRLFGAGVLFGAAALTRSTSLYLLPVVAAVLGLMRLRWRVALLAAGCLVVVLPYVAAASATASRLILVENLLEQDWAGEVEGPSAPRATR